MREIRTPESAADFLRRLADAKGPEHLAHFGISNIIQIFYFKELTERFRIIHVTEGLSSKQLQLMKFSHAPSLQDAIDETSGELPHADVAIFPSGGTSTLVGRA